jgi:hypothetical protein
MEYHAHQKIPAVCRARQRNVRVLRSQLLRTAWSAYHSATKKLKSWRRRKNQLDRILYAMPFYTYNFFTVFFRAHVITVVFVALPDEDVAVYVPALSVFRASSSVSPHTSSMTAAGSGAPVPVQVEADTHV